MAESDALLAEVAALTRAVNRLRRLVVLMSLGGVLVLVVGSIAAAIALNHLKHQVTDQVGKANQAVDGLKGKLDGAQSNFRKF